MYKCLKCNKEFYLENMLIQHLNDTKDEKHCIQDKKDKSQSDNCSKPKKLKNRDIFPACFGKMILLRRKPNLTENEKIELDELTELIKVDGERRTKNLNKKFGLPEDTPFEISYRLQKEEWRLQDEEYKRLHKESLKDANEFREIIRKRNEIIRKRNETHKRYMEKMNTDAWEISDKSAKEFKEKNPYFKLEITPIKPEDNIECAPCISPACPPPLKNKAKKNKLLNMSTG